MIQALLGIALVALVVSFFVFLLVLNALVELYFEIRTKITHWRLRRGVKTK